MIIIQEISAFNSRFESFVGNNKTYRDVRAIFSAVIASNRAQVTNETKHYIDLETSAIKTKKLAPISLPTLEQPVDITNGHTYTIMLGYDSGGYISCFSVYDETEGKYIE